MKLLSKIVILALSLIFILISLVYILNHPLTYDESFNLQVPVSLKESLTYKSLYIPGKIYDPRITTNGIIHYIQAFLLSIFKSRFYAVRIFIFLIFLSFLSIAYFKNKLFLVFFIATWFLMSEVRYISSSYLGEVFSLVFVLLTFLTLKNIKQATSSSVYKIISSGIFLGIAITTKNINIIFLPYFITFFKNKKQVFLFLCTTCFYMLSDYLFSITLSYISSNGTITGFVSFLKDNASRLIRRNLGRATKRPLNFRTISILIKNYPIVLFIFIVSVVRLIKKEKNVFLLLLPFLYFLFKLRVFRHVFILFYFICFQYFFENSSKKSLVNFSLLAFLFISIFLNKSLIHIKQEVKRHSVQKNNQIKVANFIRQIDYPIITNGWWQIPEISFLSNKKFIDRMVYKKRVSGTKYLFASKFQKNFWPTLDFNKACRKIIFCKYGYMLCEYNESLKLNFTIWPKPNVNHARCKVF